MDYTDSSKIDKRPQRLSLFVLLLLLLPLSTCALHQLTAINLELMTEEKLHSLARKAARWVRAERATQRPLASALTDSELQAFSPFFPPSILENARVRAVAEMPTPRFAGQIRYRGKKIFNFRRVRGLALEDTILLQASKAPSGSAARRSVLFHELVHLVQYKALGVDRFFAGYFASLAANGRYADIAFEAQAFALQNRFKAHPDEGFSVADEVHRLIQKLSPPEP